jgi:hypothetical protein
MILFFICVSVCTCVLISALVKYLVKEYRIVGYISQIEHQSMYKAIPLVRLKFHRKNSANRVQVL